jgi:hypothetical protein
MAVERVARVGARAAASAPIGISAQLGDAMSRLRTVVPVEAWDDVQDEVRRLQQDQQLSRLAALQAVYAKIVTGWRPRRR